MQHFIYLTVITELLIQLYPSCGPHNVRRTGTCWSEPRGPKMLRELEHLCCGDSSELGLLSLEKGKLWGRLRPVPAPIVATRELERDTGQGGMALD